MSEQKIGIKYLVNVEKAILSFILISGKPQKRTEITKFFKQAQRHINRSSHRKSTQYKVSASQITTSLKNLVDKGYLEESPIFFVPKRVNKAELLIEIAESRAVDFDVRYLHSVIRIMSPISYWGYFRNNDTSKTVIGELLYCIATDRAFDFKQAYVNLSHNFEYLNESEQEEFDAFEKQLYNTNETGYFKHIGPKVLSLILENILSEHLENLEQWSDILTNTVDSHLQKALFKQEFDSVLTMYLAHNLLSGRFDEIKKTPYDLHENSFYLMTLGCVQLFEGNYDLADSTFVKALAAHKKTPKQVRGVPAFSMSFFYFLSFAKNYTAGYKKLQSGAELFKEYPSTLFPSGEKLLTSLAYFSKNKTSKAKMLLSSFESESALETVLSAHITHWFEGEISSDTLDRLEDILEICTNNKFLWLQMETAKALALFSRTSSLKEAYETEYQTLCKIT